MSYRREILKLNRDNFATWQGLMRLYLATIKDSGCKYLDVEYKTPTGILLLLVEDITEKNYYNIMMIDIVYVFSYAEFDEVKDYKNGYEMWTKLKDIYGEYENVRRAKAESLRGNENERR